jgi:hypothetical protein
MKKYIQRVWKRFLMRLFVIGYRDGYRFGLREGYEAGHRVGYDDGHKAYITSVWNAATTHHQQ